VVQRLAQIVVGGEAVHELHGLGRVELGIVPAEPDIEIDDVIVRLEVELLDVVDIGADDHFVRSFRQRRGFDRLDHAAQRRVGRDRFGRRRTAGNNRKRQGKERGGNAADD